MYNLTMDNSDFSGERYGLLWVHGKTSTKDAYLAERLGSKTGITCEYKKGKGDKPVPEQGEA